MKKISKVKSIIAILFLLLMLIYLFSNRTKNVFEEIYYSENPAIIKSGVTNTSLLSVRECYRGNSSLEYELGMKIFDINLNENAGIEINIKKNQNLNINPYFKDEYLKNTKYYVSMYWLYDIREKILYVNTSLKEYSTHETVKNIDEVLPQFLEEQGIEANSLKEVSDIILKDFLNQWFEGNSMSKFNMDNLGDFEIVYE